MLPYRTVHEMLWDMAQMHALRDGYRYKNNGQWLGLTWAEVESRVAELGRALMTLGALKGDRIGVLAQTSIRWVLSDLGIVCSGCVTVGIYPNNTAADCRYILDHAEIGILILENDAQLEKILSIRDQLPQLRTIVTLEGTSDSSLGVLSWDEFLECAARTEAQTRLQQAQSIEPDDLASLVYTSGTTGVPKGVMLSHKNLVFAGWSAGGAIYHEPDFVVLMFLPLAHVFARMIVYASMFNVTTMAVDGDIDAIAQHLQEVRPHYVTCVPRVFEKVHDKILAKAHAAGGLKARLFNWALSIGRRASRIEQARQPVPPSLRVARRIADLLVFRKVRAAFGGRLVFAISGSAPLSVEIAEFFDACGVRILEGIGMTENTAFSNVNRIDDNRLGTVGPPGRGIEIRIADDGEVLIRGGNVMLGYYKDEAATRETLVDGWLHTGDIGELNDGFLKITDRKKDLIITAGGKNVAPQHLESVLKTSRYISHAAAYGDRRKFITALVTLDADVLLPWAAAHGLGDRTIEQLASEAQVQRLISMELERLNGRLARYETIKKFFIVPGEFTIEAGEITPTMKLRRRVIVDKYRAELDALY